MAGLAPAGGRSMFGAYGGAGGGGLMAASAAYAREQVHNSGTLARMVFNSFSQFAFCKKNIDLHEGGQINDLYWEDIALPFLSSTP